MKNSNLLKISLRHHQYLKAIAIVAGLIAAGASQAATFTWTGGAANANWSSAGNWGGTPPNNDGTDDIHMAGTTRLSNRPNGGFDINSLTFDAGAGAFTLNRVFATDVLALEGGGIVNNSVNVQTINNDIGMIASQSINAAAGDLVFGGTIDLFSTTLTIAGANNATFGGVIQGLGSISKTGAGVLNLSGPSTFAGGVSVSSGTLALGNNSGAGTGPITLSGGALQGSGGARSVANNIIVGAGGGTVSGAQNITASGVVSGSGALAVTSSGTFAITTASTYSGPLTISGPVSLGVNGALASVGSISLNSSGSLTLNADGGNLVNDSASIGLNGGALNANNKTEGLGAVTLASGSSTINLVADSTHGTLTLASLTAAGGLLTVNGWSGTAALGTPPSTGTDDHIFLTAGAGTDTFIADVSFAGFGSGAIRIGATGELVPVPEPKAIAASIALLAFAGWRWFSRKNQANNQLPA